MVNNKIKFGEKNNLLSNLRHYNDETRKGCYRKGCSDIKKELLELKDDSRNRKFNRRFEMPN